ncbi:hypothetical protein GQ44DRAFT_758951 [Phaeosphaeriaceae sp. PMI808]|nr:hypothetical protein GQ44DRAFT_758951 [Phaeosphaeriaceae sp. PMI808]
MDRERITKKRNMQSNFRMQRTIVQAQTLDSTQDIASFAMRKAKEQESKVIGVVTNIVDCDIEDMTEEAVAGVVEDNPCFIKKYVASIVELSHSGRFQSPLHLSLVEATRVVAITDECAIEDSDEEDSPPDYLVEQAPIFEAVNGELQEQRPAVSVTKQPLSETRKDSATSSLWLPNIFNFFTGCKKVSKFGEDQILSSDPTTFTTTREASYWKCVPIPPSPLTFPKKLSLREVIPTVRKMPIQSPSNTRDCFNALAVPAEVPSNTRNHYNQGLLDRTRDPWAQWYAKHPGSRGECVTCEQEAVSAAKHPYVGFCW